MLGSGAIVVMDETTDMVLACWRIVRFFARETCGKCTPCREGTTWLERILRRIIDGHGRPSDLDLLLDVSDNISPGLAWPPAPDHDLPARAVGGVADRVGHAALPARVRGLHRARRRARSRPRRGPGARRCLTRSRSRRATVTVTIDGKEIEAEPGELVIAAAERHGVYIPRFCYHERMDPVGMCRMCLVDIDTGRGPALGVSCMVNVSEGMKVETESDRVHKAQEGVLEFLLINHPLDCPVCDKGGECPLQDQTMTWGPGESRFVEEKRHYEKPIPISDLVFLDRERCILCDRCTRFAKDVAGDPLIHFMQRGNQTQVMTFPDEPFASYFSGNTVQICPVGALTAKPYRFKARPWDLDQTESTCTTCSVGCRVTVQASRNELLRYQGVDSDPVNWGWLCDKGRFGFEAVNSAERLCTPRWCARAVELVEVSWSQALSAAADAIAQGTGGRRAQLDRRDRRCPRHQRGRLRLGQAGQGRPRHRQRRRPARRRAGAVGAPGPAPGHDRRGAPRPPRDPARARPEGGAARPLPPPARLGPASPDAARSS